MKNLNKLKLNTLIIFSILILNLVFVSNIFAEENDNISNEEILSKQEAINAINDSIQKIKENINVINKKISTTKFRNEYETYPAVRLNIDTPLFGLSSIVNKKLKITKEVSAIDVASGYSIIDIVRKNKVKVPSLAIGSVIVLTRDVKINENITHLDANTVLLYLMQYIKQSEEVDEFLDNQINKIFIGYITKEKNDKISDISNRLDTVKTSLADQDNKIVALNIINNSNEEYKNLINDSSIIYNKVITLKEKIQEILITDENLKNVEKETLLLEENILDFKTNIEEKYNKALLNYDILTTIKNIKTDVISSKDEITKYIDNSEINITDVQDEISKKERVYEITSEYNLKYMNDLLIKLEEKITKYTPINESTNLPEEVINKAEVINAENSNKITDEERKSLIEELVSIYREYTIKENNFYMDNINKQLSDSTSKISGIVKITDKNIVNTIKYMYIELPENLQKYNDSNNSSFNMEVKKITYNLKQEIIKSLNFTIDLNKIYSEINENGLGNSNR